MRELISRDVIAVIVGTYTRNDWNHCAPSVLDESLSVYTEFDI